MRQVDFLLAAAPLRADQGRRAPRSRWIGLMVAAAVGLGAAVAPLSAHAEETLAAADVLGASTAVAADVPEMLSAPIVRKAASDRYRAGALIRFAFGDGYRDLWESEIEIPVLDLQKEGGGLVPTGRFGGLQTAVIGFRGRDGRSYSFRGTDKDPSAVLDPMLHDTVVQTVVQDQMSAQHPGGPPVAGALTEAAGVLTVAERTVVLPDDPALGEYRAEFAGRVGSFFEYPQPAAEGRQGFQGAIEILDHEELYARLEAGEDDAVDAEAFLRARLLDLLIGDFDRHRKQWRWARLAGDPRWQPIPEDRDQAFVRSNGAGPALARIYIPILQNYGPDYPWIKGLTLHGWEQDRWLLPQVSWPAWQRIVEEIQSRLSDEVIDAALARLPVAYDVLDGERLRQDIRGRRDRLPEGARAYYRHLAREVDIQASDQSEAVSIEHAADGTTRVRIMRGEAPGEPRQGAVSFDRIFHPAETKDVRLYLRGGDDAITVRGGRGRIRVRLLGTAGRKKVAADPASRAVVYNADGLFEISGASLAIDDKDYTPPESDAGFVDVEDVPPRDWGSDTIPIPDLSFQPDAGLYLGLSAQHTRYGFRKHPWSSRHRFTGGWAFEANAPRVRYEGAFRPENSPLLASLEVEYSGIEVLRFYGFGNETRDRGNDRFFRVRNQIYRVEPTVSTALGDERLRISGGPTAKLSRTSSGARLIDILDPYGNNDFGLIGAKVNLTFDTRESVKETNPAFELPFHANPAAGYPTRGFLLDVTARVSPPVWDVEETYGSIEGSIAGYLSFGEGARLTLSARVGGQETFGRTPYFDLAYIGGGRFFSGAASNRGFRSRRFAGDSSVYGNLDARVLLGRAKIVVPSDFGVLAYFDSGRVFFHDESSDDWHLTGGLGVWISPLIRTNTISFSVAGGAEELLSYLRFGFHY